nr:NADH dehydrogenase subunit 2 [Cladonema multiramosum]
MVILMIFYFALLSLFFFKRETFAYLFIIMTVFCSILWFSILPSFPLEELWFLGLITLSFILVFEVSFENSLDIQFLKFLVWLGSSIIILSSNLIMIYIGLELQTFSLFVLISKNKGFIKSSESGLKYFILGALSSGFFLVSIISLFHYYNCIDLKLLTSLYNSDYYFYIFLFLLMLSLLFKLSLFPLHFWIPDIYEGSSSDVISIIATLPKISIIFLIMKLALPFSFLLWSGILSIIVGCLGALNQTKVKRLLAYSSITHLGFVGVGLSLFGEIGIELGLIYFLIYIINSLGLLFLLIQYKNQEEIYVIELSGLQFSTWLWAFLWVVIFFSVAGLPPLFGFLGKWWIITNLINYDYIFISFLVILFSCISIAFYLRIGKIIYFEKSYSYLMWKSILINNQKLYSGIYIVSLLCFFCIFSVIIPELYSSVICLFKI